MPLVTGRVWVTKKKVPLAALRDGNDLKSDLFMFNCDLDRRNQDSLIYYESVKKVYLKPTLFSSTPQSNGCWFTKDTAVGIHTLAGAQIVVEFNWKRATDSPNVDALLSKVRPDSIRADTGKTVLFLKKLETRTAAPEGLYAAAFALSTYAEARLPDETGIVDRRLAIPPIRMTSTVSRH